MVTTPPFASIAALREKHLELLKRHRDRREDREFLDDAAVFIQNACRTGLVLDREADRDEAQRIVDTWTTRLYRSGREVAESTLDDFDEKQAPEPTGRPYVGFDAFSEQDRKFFCGRDSLVSELLDRLKTSNLIALVGPSGSGKSSLMLAGVAPALLGGALPGSEGWFQSGRIVPGSDPLRHLAAALARASGRDRNWEDEQIALMRQHPNRLSDLLTGICAAGSVLMIDQFEEVFTLCQSEQDQRAFDANLAAAVQSPARHVVLLTMRDDYLGYLRLVPRMQPLIDQAMRVPKTLTEEELRDAIQRPAEMVGLRFEDGVVDALVDDLKGVSAALPLLQFTLLQLWDRKSRNRVTMSAYREIGGGKLGLARVADEFFEKSLLKEEQEIAKRIFMWLVKPGQGMVDFVSSRVRQIDLYQIAPPQVVDPVLNKLLGARLIKVTKPQSNADAEVEVAHEALIRNWGLLGEWLSRAREELTMKQRLELRATDWERQSRKAGLLDELSLREFEVWLETPEAQLLGCSTSAKDLIAASKLEVQRKFRRERRIRRAWILGCIGGVILAAIAVYFAIFAYRQRNEAIENAQRANELGNLSTYNYRQTQEENGKLQDALNKLQDANTQLGHQEEVLAATNKENHRLANRYWATVYSDAAKLGGDNNPELSALLALYANSFTWDTERAVLDPVLVALRNAISGMRTEMVLRLDKPERLVNPPALAFSVDGTLLAAADSEGVIHIWDAFRGLETATLKGPRNVGSLAFCLDNKCLGTAEPDGAHIWNLDTRRDTVQARGKSVSSLAFSPDGNLHATGEDDQIRMWDAQGREVWRKDKTGIVSAIAFSHDSTLVAGGSDDGSVRVWKTASGEPVAEKRMNAPRGNSFVPPPGNPTAAPVGPPPPPVAPEKVRVTALQFTRDGYLIAGGSQGRPVRWRLPDFADDAALSSFDLYVTPDNPAGAVLAVSETNFLRGQQRVVLVSSGWPFPYATRLTGHTAAVLSAAFSPNGNRIATSSADGTVRLWTYRPPSTSSADSWGIGSSVNDAEFTPDGNYLAILLPTSAALYDSRTRRPVTSFLTRAKTSIALSADGKKIALGGAGVSIVVPGDPSRFRDFDPETRYDSVALSADGGKVVSGNSKNLKYWETSGSSGASWEVSAVTVAISSGDARWIAAGGSDGTVSLVDLKRSDLRTQKIHQGRVRSLAFDPRGRWLASGGNDRIIYLWSLSGSPNRTLTGLTEAVDKFAFSADGLQLAAITSIGTVSFWDVATGVRVRTLSGLGAFSGTHAVTYVRQGPSLLTINARGAVSRLKIDGGDFVEESFNKLFRAWSDADCQAYLQQPCPPRFQAIPLIVKANGEVRNGSLTAAQTSVDDAFKTDPKLPLDPAAYVHHLADTLTAQISSQRTDDLLLAGQFAAWAGDLPRATEFLAAAQKVPPGDSVGAAKRAANTLLSQARVLLANRYSPPYRVAEAWAYIQAVRRLDPENKMSLSPELNEICWTGSLNHLAAEVKGACEEVGASAPTNFQYVDSRGLNRALLGDYPGAIKDFEYFVKATADPKAKAQRQKYLEILEQGKNPFDDKELKDIL